MRKRLSRAMIRPSSAASTYRSVSGTAIRQPRRYLFLPRINADRLSRRSVLIAVRTAIGPPATPAGTADDKRYVFRTACRVH